MKRRCRRIDVWSLAVGFLGVPTALQAQDEGWRFAVTPYFWALKINGDMTVFGEEHDVDIDTGDILDKLEFALMAHIEAGTGDVSFFISPIYAALNNEGTVQVPVVGDVESEVDIDNWMLDLGAAYRIWGPLEVTGGARYYSLNVTTELGDLGEEDRDTDWWNGFVGARIRKDFNEKWGVRLHGDVGFGDSESNYMTFGVLQYHFNPTWSANLGYKFLHDDVEPRNGFIDYSNDLYGGLLGLTMRL